MKLSVITPSYNQGQYIERTILSVINQNVPDLEYLVIDGGSKDQTIDLLKQYSGNLNWVSEADHGQADAVNKGIRRSQGEIIGWLNSDDIYYPGILNKVIDFFDSHPDVMIVYGNANHIDESDVVIEPYPTSNWNFEELFDVCFICQPAVFFRRSLVDKVGLLNAKLQYCMDYEYWLRIGEKYPFSFIPEVLAGSRLYPQTKTLGAREKVHREIIRMIYEKTKEPPTRWIYNLGHVIAREKGLLRTTRQDEMRFVFEVFKVAIIEHIRLGRLLPYKDLRTITKLLQKYLSTYWGASKL
ncbi:MAG: kfoC 2 [Neobacillus sp.]|jgi:glycosyltransferase involved in cell wall biosynthesis|nr:kfoC 2 [Neobacillus sp.]